MMLDDDTVRLYVDEAQEHLSGIEDVLLEIEQGGADADLDLVNQVFRAIHSIKGGAGFFNLTGIKDLGHDMENVLNLIRNKELVATPDIVNVLLNSADMLRKMFEDLAASNDLDTSHLIKALQAIEAGEAPPAADAAPAPATQAEAPPEPVPEPETRPDPEPPSPSPDLISAEDLEDAAALHPYLFQLSINVVEDLRNPGRGFQSLVGELRDNGSIVVASTDLNRKTEPRRGILTIIMGSTQPAEALLANINLPADRLLVLAEEIEEATVAAPEPAPAPATTAPRPSPAPAPAPAKAPAVADDKAPAAAKAPITAESKLRVSVALLDKLMILAGELVLTRNQMSLAISSEDSNQINQASQRLDQITSELQEVIVSTRMQPVGVVFTKFRRIVRDMARQLGKNIELIIEGEEVELDKTIIEGLSDPLTHLVRNGIDHGIEFPDERAQTDKDEQATLNLRAFHEAGQVIIEVSDDGRGIDPQRVKAKALENGLRERAVLDAMTDNELVKLIFLPGFSTAQEVTEISGRGVGMDVVATNLAAMGGVVDITSELGKGSTIRIKLPLTLAIIPSLIIALGEKRYAVPQVNVQELVRIPAHDIARRIQTIGNSEIMRLRGELLPIVRLSEILQLEPVYRDKETGELRRDRRATLADRRGVDPDAEAADRENREGGSDRRSSFFSALNIVVVLAGSLRYGLVVDQLLDSEEIVVKPLDKHFQGRQIYAGATIQGDGGVAMILDVVELSRFVELDSSRLEAMEAKQRARDLTTDGSAADKMSLLLVKSGDSDTFAIPLPLITRIEKIERSKIEVSGRRRSMIYRDGSLVLFTIDDAADVNPIADGEEAFIVVFSVNKREVGLMVSALEDTVNVAVEFDRETFRQPGIFGSAIIRERTTLLVDLFGVVEAVEPTWISRSEEVDLAEKSKKTILAVEDSKFFLDHLRGFLEENGYSVITAMDGMQGLEKLAKHVGSIDLVMTDIEMPVMDGFEFTQHIRAAAEYRHLPVIAVTSLAGDMDKARGFESGVNEYLIKLDKEEILNSLDRHLHTEGE